MLLNAWLPQASYPCGNFKNVTKQTTGAVSKHDTGTVTKQTTGAASKHETGTVTKQTTGSVSKHEAAELKHPHLKGGI